MSDRKRSKTETITLRVDPKSKFMIEFLARIDNQSLTAVVDAAIRDRADSRGVTVGYDESEHVDVTRKWHDFWDPSDGIRTLRLLAEPAFKTSFEEDEIRQFTLDHWPFFYTNRGADIPRRAFVDIIWPSLEKVLEIWRSTKSQDYWAAGKEMQHLLKSAGVAPPRWPPKEEIAAANRQTPDDLDDDIPF